MLTRWTAKLLPTVITALTRAGIHRPLSTKSASTGIFNAAGEADEVEMGKDELPPDDGPALEEEANQQQQYSAFGSEEMRKRFKYSEEELNKHGFNVYPYRIERAWWQEGKRMTFWANWRQLADVRRRRTFAQLGPDRMRYKAMKTNTILPRAIIDEFQERMNTMPKAAHPKQILNLCQFTGKSRGKYNRFRVNRQIFRQLADRGQLSGVVRALW